MSISAIQTKALDQAALKFYESLPAWLQLAAGGVIFLVGIAGLGGITTIFSRWTRGQPNAEDEKQAIDAQIESLRQQSQHLSQIAQTREVLDTLIRPALEGRANQRLILQFLILYVILVIWGWFSNVYSIVAGALFGLLQQRADFDSPLASLGPVIYSLIALLPAVGTAIILFFIGLPLLRQALVALGTSFRDLFRRRAS